MAILIAPFDEADSEPVDLYSQAHHLLQHPDHDGYQISTLAHGHGRGPYSLDSQPPRRHISVVCAALHGGEFVDELLSGLE